MKRPSASSQLVIGIAVIAVLAVMLSQAAHPSEVEPGATPVAHITPVVSPMSSNIAIASASGATSSAQPVTSGSGSAAATIGPAQAPSAYSPSLPIPTSQPTQAPTSARTPRPSANGGQDTLAQLLGLLPTVPEDRTGYSRDLFVHWIDANGDGCDTRHEVLIDQSLTPVTVGISCSLSGGSWLSFYDGLTFTDPSKLDIDHVVPLAEAWDSGASAWSADRRERYANDLGVPWALIAVSASSNRSKGDRDPAEWMPPAASAECTYLGDWLAVKVRWQLSVDPTERHALSGMIGDCPTTTMPVVIENGPPVPTPPTPAPTGQQTPTPTTNANCAASYPDFCIPPPPPDLNCSDIPQRNFTVLWNVPDPDPHHFDGDKDGVGCEA